MCLGSFALTEPGEDADDDSSISQPQKHPTSNIPCIRILIFIQLSNNARPKLHSGKIGTTRQALAGYSATEYREPHYMTPYPGKKRSRMGLRVKVLQAGAVLMDLPP